jgi:hypothetical protein
VGSDPAAKAGASTGAGSGRITWMNADDFGAEGDRLGPHELPGYGNMGSRPAREKRPSHDDDSGGAFGSGGHES